jgi:hypothetical protein
LDEEPSGNDEELEKFDDPEEVERYKEVTDVLEDISH